MIVKLATASDIPAICELMEKSIAQLMTPYLSAPQIAASREFMGLDTQLIEDGCYFICVDENNIIGCGGWSKRTTLFGGDHTKGRDTKLLNPGTDPARVRAMYTDPEHVRRGAGRQILKACEDAALAEEFTKTELAATLAGAPLYRACGYTPIKEFTATASNGVEVPLILMGKTLSKQMLQ